MEAKIVKILDGNKIAARAFCLQPFVKFVHNIIDSLVREKIISCFDAESLCLADDTAAWLCGRVSDCNFVTFRIASKLFNRAKAQAILYAFKWEESCEQILWGDTYENLVYMNFSASDAVAVKLVVWRGSGPITMSNPCPQFSYFIKVLKPNHIISKDKIHESYCVEKTPIYLDLNSVICRDCDCLRRTTHTIKSGDGQQYVNLLFDLEERDDTNTYHKSFIIQEDLIEEPYDDGSVEIVCSCKL
ncbi:late expression factor 12 [Orgyia leucostigma nucleopolyhedrovirus]|uniref:Late expression factor 12 n=1 Tax=Orgyia leucostigma nucleopolyhedrovirus TaxID=490711 RepID=B0FDR8_9ABAC|nr:late expression factor 12 [Orgyia leucostigma nucleopolyhedrovirus]ABY65776.1 late expression factor 12 [Orgyia leucostigma nucleopolyhedrovirus]